MYEMARVPCAETVVKTHYIGFQIMEERQATGSRKFEGFSGGFLQGVIPLI